MSQAKLQIDFKVLAHNFSYLKSQLRSSTKFMAIVKANAYGSDAVMWSQTLEALGADYLAVAYCQEAIALRDAGINIPILVFHPQKEDLENLVNYDLEAAIYSLEQLKSYRDYLIKSDKAHLSIHLNINTGLNRLGIKKEDISKVIALLQNQNKLRLKWLMSHLAASDDLAQLSFSEDQAAAFEEVCHSIETELNQAFKKHLLNSSGIFSLTHKQYDMVRSGIALHGYSNLEHIDPHLKVVAHLKAKVTQVFNISKGEYVGYNFGFQAGNDMTLATVAMGHADGMDRKFGQKQNQVFFEDTALPILGNICMDMFMVDVSNTQIKAGDWVSIFDAQHNADLSAKSIGTISYELLCAISSRVEREFILLEN